MLGERKRTEEHANTEQGLKLAPGGSAIAVLHRKRPWPERSRSDVETVVGRWFDDEVMQFVDVFEDHFWSHWLQDVATAKGFRDAAFRLPGQPHGILAWHCEKTPGSWKLQIQCSSLRPGSNIGQRTDRRPSIDQQALLE